MTKLYILLGILVVLFVICVFGLVLSLKHKKKMDKLKSNADCVFKNKGVYNFNYLIKTFGDANNKKMKIIIDPELGFADLSTATTNTCIAVFCTFSTISGVLLETFPITNYDHTLNVEYVIDVPKKFLDSNGKLNVQVSVHSAWNLCGNDVDEKFIFNYNE